MAPPQSDGLRTFSGAVALITGGASGIGAALAQELVGRGAKVVLADRQLDVAQRLAKDLGENARAVSLDVREPAAFAAVAAGVVETEGRIDYFFNNAGIGLAGLFEEHSLEDWKYIVDINLLGVVSGLHCVYPIMLKQGFGHIVNTASMAGRVATPALSAYNATKHAVVGLSRSLRIEAAGRGVRVSAFCPGPIRTPILKDGGAFGKFVGADTSNMSDEAVEKSRPMKVEEFATKALDAVAANREIIIFPKLWRVVDWVDRHFPSFLGRMMTRRFTREHTKMQKMGE
jgi:short-subunit dehydrogenase